MKKRAIGAVTVLAAAAFLLGGGTQAVAEYRVRSGLQDSGMSEKTSACMARRMVKRLTIMQLFKLQAMEGEKRNLGDYIKSVRRVGDGEVIAVTASSAALCASGLAR